MDGDIKLFDEFDWTPERDRQMLELRQTGMTIADIRVTAKEGGQSGSWQRA